MLVRIGSPCPSITTETTASTTTTRTDFFRQLLVASCYCLLTQSSVSSAMALASSSSSTCAVVGVGVLGTSLCQQLLESPDFAQTNIIGITKSTSRHEDIKKAIGGQQAQDRFQLFTMDEIIGDDTDSVKFDNVVFCAPPSGSDDYPAAVKDAVDRLWKGPSGGGSFVFTSSGAVFGPGESDHVNESSPTADPESSPRVARLVNAERACLDAGGCCLRLAGLYNLQRGAHNFWITSDKPVAGGPDGIINLLHYDDAAGACLAALKAGPSVTSGKAFLVSDGHPMTRKQICASALKAKVYQNYNMPEFAGEDVQKWVKGKIYDGTKTNEMLHWKPRYASFDEFMSQNA